MKGRRKRVALATSPFPDFQTAMEKIPVKERTATLAVTTSTALVNFEMETGALGMQVALEASADPSWTVPWMLEGVEEGGHNGGYPAADIGPGIQVGYEMEIEQSTNSGSLMLLSANQTKDSEANYSAQHRVNHGNAGSRQPHFQYQRQRHEHGRWQCQSNGHENQPQTRAPEPTHHTSEATETTPLAEIYNLPSSAIAPP